MIREVLNPTPLNPTPATCHKRKQKLHCSFWNAALQKLHCNIRFSAVRTSFVPKAALQQTKNCTATSKSLRCKKAALSCRFPAGFKPPRLGTHVSDLLSDTNGRRIAIQIGGVYTTFCQGEGILLQKYHDRNGRCVSRCFSKAWGSWVDLALLINFLTVSLSQRSQNFRLNP